MSIRSRLEALEKAMNARYQSGLHVTLIEGGLPYKDGPRCAQAGGHTWEREPQETLEQFIERCHIEAHGFGETLLVVGGFTGPIPEKLEDFLDQLHFDEVPPEEPAGYVR
jgi:hypothetical protein